MHIIKNVLENIGGVGLFGVISIGIFFTFFTAMLIWVFCLRKPYIETMRGLPLDNDDASNDQSETNPNS